MSYDALDLYLRSKVDLIWARAFQLVIAQSVQFSKIAPRKKLKIDLYQFCSHLKEELFLLKS